MRSSVLGDSCPPQPIRISDKSLTINHWIKLIRVGPTPITRTMFRLDLRESTHHDKYAEVLQEWAGWWVVQQATTETDGVWPLVRPCRLPSLFILTLCWERKYGSGGVGVGGWLVFSKTHITNSHNPSLANSPVSSVSNWIQQVVSLDETRQDGAKSSFLHLLGVVFVFISEIWQ